MKISRRSNRRSVTLRFLAASVLIALPMYCIASQTDASPPPASSSPASMLPDGPGKDLVLKDCQSCHSLNNVVARHGTADDWDQVVSQMIGRGANISDNDADTIVDYLAAHFGPSASSSNQSSTSADTAKAPSSAVPSAAPSSAPVNVNKASSDQLQSGLELTKDQADAVVHYREQNGDFKNMQQLLSVPGIDSAKLKNEQSKIAF